MNAAFKSIIRQIWLSTAGIAFPQEISKQHRDNMRWFFLEGITTSAGVAILENYFSLFLLSLGGTLSQIGIMNSLSNISATFLLLPGAILAERVKSRRDFILLTGAGIARFTFLIIAFAPLVFKGSSLLFIVIGLKIFADATSNLATPAWMALIPDIVPIKIRGRYFGSRNAATAFVSMIITFLAGHIITAISSPLGYQVGIGMAFLIGVIATFSYTRIIEERQVQNPPDLHSYYPRSLIHTLKGDRGFFIFCLSQMIWNLSISLAGPFFTPFMVEVLGGTAAIIGTLTIISSITGIVGQRFFGSLADKIGNRKVIILVGLLIPFLPFLWFFMRTPWQTIPIYFFSGFLWAGYTLTTFNQILELSPPDQRGRYSALYQISITISSAIGAGFGGMVAQSFGYKFLFGLSGVGRLCSILMFIFLARQIRPKSYPSPGGECQTNFN